MLKPWRGSCSWAPTATTGASATPLQTADLSCIFATTTTALCRILPTTPLPQGQRRPDARRLLQPERDNGKGAGVVEAAAGERAHAGAHWHGSSRPLIAIIGFLLCAHRVIVFICNSYVSRASCNEWAVAYARRRVSKTCRPTGLSLSRALRKFSLAATFSCASVEFACCPRALPHPVFVVRSQTS